MMLRRYRLANMDCRDTDLTAFADEIIRTIEQTVPGKDPHVYRNSFTVDGSVTQSEAVAIGHALAKLPCLNSLGKFSTVYRLFSGRMEDTNRQKKKKSN